NTENPTECGAREFLCRVPCFIYIPVTMCHNKYTNAHTRWEVCRMNVTEAIRKRRSIRKYQEGANIPQEDLDQILEAAMMAPSARNTRPWDFVVVENREVLNKFPDIQPYTRMMH